MDLSKFFDIALIIISIALTASVIFQNRGVGLGGLTGVDSSGAYSARRGFEKTLFYITIALSVIFVILVCVTVSISG